MLTVITAAESYDIATLAAVKAALGITGTAEDLTLPPLISRASAAIATACNRVLVEETVEETVRDARCGIMLQRYPVTSVTTVTEDGTGLVPADYEADLGCGIIERLRSDSVGCWARGRTVIRYRAGYTLETMPPDIVQALVMVVAQFRSQAARDPLLRAEETTDVERLEWQVGIDDGIPASVRALLVDHRRPAGA
ncbi:phage head-tail connector protein [Rhodopseudomonas sp. P2A-2r]|uniref:phage head-tail connector protein n=1 Tax=Rhodopseudomonas sp. P2A-2r TaxID=2991972 RepID=UPI002234D730|nr:phage head-tail connector protein [Rhodopseudomonas sp. P2A-2r]UZE46982.1 phage head-tail connector protein [Rhodopseudomonas sp. P2A-2r]